MESNASSADDFGPARLTLMLPVAGPKGPLRIEVEAASLEELIPLIQGLPGSGRDASAEQGGDPLAMTLDFLSRYEERAKEIVTRWAVNPKVSFDGPKPGHIEWRKLHLQNRIAIVNGITSFSQTGSAGEAERLATFPAQQHGGTGNGRGVGGALTNGDAATPDVAETSGAISR